MQYMKRQSGMTMWGMLFVLGTFAFFLFLFFKLLPPYMTDFKISSALTSVGQQSDVGTMTVAEIQNALYKHLEIDSADDFDIKDALTVENHGSTRVIRIAYQATVPMAFNISALIDFDHSIEVRGGSS